MPTQDQVWERLEPLNITCTSADCEAGLHCFKQTRKMKTADAGGRCRYCGEELVDWDRTHHRDLTDVHYTFKALKTEMYRHHYWHLEIDQRALNHARRKGRKGMREAAERRVTTSVGGPNPFRDGMQTPKNGNALYYAQHATAICCRKCIEEWHGIPQGVKLTLKQIAYFTELLMLYISERLPFLTEDGEQVPAIRRKAGRSNK